MLLKNILLMQMRQQNAAATAGETPALQFPGLLPKALH
jgi:hypothetical protein